MAAEVGRCLLFPLLPWRPGSKASIKTGPPADEISDVGARMRISGGLARVVGPPDRLAATFHLEMLRRHLATSAESRGLSSLVARRVKFSSKKFPVLDGMFHCCSAHRLTWSTPRLHRSVLGIDFGSAPSQDRSAGDVLGRRGMNLIVFTPVTPGDAIGSWDSGQKPPPGTTVSGHAMLRKS